MLRTNFINQLIDWSYYNLLENDEAQQYLLGRGVSKDQWEQHRIGYVSDPFIINCDEDINHNEGCLDKNKRSLWCDSCNYTYWSSFHSKNEDGNEILKNHGERIVGSILLPLTTYSRQAVGFQIRSMLEKRYDTFLVKERPEPFFFGIGHNIDIIWKTKTITLVEGPFDQLIFERLVCQNVVALTTNSVSQLQQKFLSRFVTKVNLCLDLDAAGRKGVETFIKFNSSVFNTVNIKYPKIKESDKDLGDFWKSSGDNKFRQYFSKVIK